MKHIPTLLALLTLGTSVIAQQPAEVSKAMAPFQGTWLVVTLDGKPATGAGPAVSLTITGNSYAQIVDGTATERGTLKIDTAKKPMTVDLAILEGDDAGKPQAGLIEVSGDTLTLHLAMPGSTTRPSSMAPEPGFLLFTARKAK